MNIKSISKENIGGRSLALNLFWSVVFIIALIVSFYFSWLFLSSQNFLYGFLYENTDLELFIERYAPQNRYKPQFALTDKDERIRLFSEIVLEINDDGSGLSDIRFYSPEGDELGYLLREAEVSHLVLVSDLVSYFKDLSLILLAILIFFIGAVIYSRLKLPQLSAIFLIYLFFISLAGLTVFIVSPLVVFETLHEIFFPPGHQWFFYYQDSLMTTLMMAPKLFGYFAVLWILLSLVIWVLFTVVLVKCVSIRAHHSDL